jgi:hypothetical protein
MGSRAPPSLCRGQDAAIFPAKNGLKEITLRRNIPADENSGSGEWPHLSFRFMGMYKVATMARMRESW